MLLNRKHTIIMLNLQIFTDEHNYKVCTSNLINYCPTSIIGQFPSLLFAGTSNAISSSEPEYIGSSANKAALHIIVHFQSKLAAILNRGHPYIGTYYTVYQEN